MTLSYTELLCMFLYKAKITESYITSKLFNSINVHNISAFNVLSD